MVSVNIAEVTGGKHKISVISRYADILKHLRALHNFEALFAIFSVLKNSPLRSKLSKVLLIFFVSLLVIAADW